MSLYPDSMYDFPNVSAYDSDLREVLAMLRGLTNKMRDFEVINKITNAGAWDITKQYKPWTIVSDNNIGYISVRPVPAGIEITNTDYWALVADYDILITNLSERISALEIDNASNKNRLTAIETNLSKRRFFFLGDSLGAGYTPDVPLEESHGWIYWVSEYVKRAGYEVLSNIDVPGVGSRAFANPNNSYAQALLYNIQNNPDFTGKYITDIVVYAGTNDDQYTDSEIENGIAAFMDVCKTYYPYAHVKIGYFGCWRNNSHARVYNILKTCAKHGAAYIENTYWLAHHKTYIESDLTHLSQAGYEYYSKWLAQGALNGCVSFKFEHSIIASYTTPAAVDFPFTVVVTEAGAELVFTGYNKIITFAGSSALGVNVGFTNPTNIMFRGYRGVTTPQGLVNLWFMCQANAADGALYFQNGNATFPVTVAMEAFFPMFKAAEAF